VDHAPVLQPITILRVRPSSSPHLHRLATQRGCRITNIQKYLGHKWIDTTLTYARAHDQRVADDYYQAMGSVEKRLELIGQPEENEGTVSEPEREALLTLVTQLAEPELSLELRMEMVLRMREVLSMNRTASSTFPLSERRQQEYPPPSLNRLGQ
jgi:hypothetical protein